MADKPKESLEKFRKRVADLEKPFLTSPLFTKVGWPLFGLGVILWLIYILLDKPSFFLSIFALLAIGGGVSLIVISLMSSHSESVEEQERSRLIRDRNKVSRCLYLEGRVPDGKGNVGRCTLYEFDMSEYPYCIYCNEYNPSKGTPDIHG